MRRRGAEAITAWPTVGLYECTASARADADHVEAEAFWGFTVAAGPVGFGVFIDMGRNSLVVRVVRLGSPRAANEGTRIGTVRRPPRGVPKAKFAEEDWYDVWYPNLAPTVETMKMALSAETDADWAAFVRKYRAEMATPENDRTLDLLAALSQGANFSVGCYCEEESRCHRSVLRSLLERKGAKVAP